MNAEIFENDAGSETVPPADRGIPSVAAPAARQYILGGTLLLLALIAIIFVIIDGTKKNQPRSFVQAEEIAFKNTASLAAPYIQPEPPLPEPAQYADISDVPPYDPLAAQQELALQQEALRMAQEQKRRMEQRIASPQLIFDQTSAGGTVSSPASNPPGTGTAGLPGPTDSDMGFANHYANQDVETAVAGQLQNLHGLIPEGTMIGGTLETAIQSDLPGMVRAIISEDVYSFDGSRLLIPKGSRLIGRYRSGMARGQSRVFVIWNRLIRNDGVTINIGSYGTDALGRSGLAGEVDTHFLERFGSSVLLSLIDTGLKVGVQSMDDSDSTSIALKTGGDFSSAAEIALENSIAIPPTIHVDQGTRIKVFVGKDLDFSQVSGKDLRE